MNIDINKLKKSLELNPDSDILEEVYNSEIIHGVCEECDRKNESDYNTDIPYCNFCLRREHLKDNFKPKQKEWYEDESNFPCLCWVSNEREEKKETASLIIKKYDSNFITKSGISWTYATPLTKEEVLKYCVGENND